MPVPYITRLVTPAMAQQDLAVFLGLVLVLVALAAWRLTRRPRA